MMDIPSHSSQQDTTMSDSCSSSSNGSSPIMNGGHDHSGNHAPQHYQYDDTRAVLQQMKHLERSTYKRPLAKQLPEPFNGLWRQQIVEWMYTLVKYCKLRHESAAAASYYLDVAVCHNLIQSPNDYQLGAMTALYLALKVYDSPCMRVVKLSSLVKLGNGEFTEDDILVMEKDMVKLLQWHVNPPTLNCFLQQYLTLLPQQFHGEDDDESSTTNSSTSNVLVRAHIEELALGAIEQMSSRDYFLSVPSSVLAYSAMLFAIETLDMRYQQHQPSSSPHLTFFEYQTFLWNMTQVADLDSTNNPLLTRASVLLDLTMKSLPIPASYMNEGESFFDDGSSNEGGQQQQQQHNVHSTATLHKDRPQDSSTATIGDVQFVDAAAGYEDSYSPNHVGMH